MEEGLQGLLMGAVLVMFLIAMESALQVVDSSEALGTDGGRADDGAENHYGTENFRKRE